MDGLACVQRSKKWSHKIDLAASNKQFRYAIPLASPKGKCVQNRLSMPIKTRIIKEKYRFWYWRVACGRVWRFYFGGKSMGLKIWTLNAAISATGMIIFQKRFLFQRCGMQSPTREVLAFFIQCVSPHYGWNCVSVPKWWKIQLIASPQLSEEDIQAINLGYEKEIRL